MLLLQILNVLALLVTLAVNGLASAGLINGRSQAEISDGIPVLFTPAGFAFSIWGVIYLSLLGFVVYQAHPRRRGDEALQRIGYWFVASCALNTLWLVVCQAIPRS